MSDAKPKFAKRGAFDDRSPNALDAIMPNQRPIGVEDLENARSIKVDLLDTNPYQPRTFHDDDKEAEAALRELAADIAAHGVLQPLLVRPHPMTPGRYQIVAGERRWRAAKQAGMAEVPCIERDMDDAAMERLALVENVQRSDLDPLDEARAYKRLIERLDLSVRAVAESLHKDHSYVAGRLALIKYADIEQQVADGTLGPTVAAGIARIEDEARRDEMVERAKRGERISVGDMKRARAVKLPEVGNIPHSATKTPATRPEGNRGAGKPSLRGDAPPAISAAPDGAESVLRAIAAESERRPLARADWERVRALADDALRA